MTAIETISPPVTAFLKTRIRPLAITFLFITAGSCSNRGPAQAKEPIPSPFVIAFGSCAVQTLPQPIWVPIRESRPDIFIFLGDTIYADTLDMAVKKYAYSVLGSVPGFRDLRKNIRILAVWDDHDYGYNDVGGDYPKKRESQALFLDFFREPPDSPRRKREGLYDSYYFGKQPRLLQVILLDTRYFRDTLEKIPPVPPFKTAYRPTTDRTKTILGKAQWEWLEVELSKPADLRIIATGIQLVADGHRGEKWGNFPHEKERFHSLIRKTGAHGVVVISGDRHYAEFSVEKENVPYPIYDITSSSLNTGWGPGSREPNRHRVGMSSAEPNFGLITIDWKERKIRAEIRSDGGKTLIRLSVDMEELRVR